MSVRFVSQDGIYALRNTHMRSSHPAVSQKIASVVFETVPMFVSLTDEAGGHLSVIHVIVERSSSAPCQSALTRRVSDWVSANAAPYYVVEILSVMNWTCTVTQGPFSKNVSSV